MAKSKYGVLQLFFSRAKIFELINSDDEHLRFVAPISSGGRPLAVPDWVKQTLTYKYGIADGSITDLTPPARRAPKVVEPEPEPEPVKEETEEEGTEQPELKNELPARTPSGISAQPTASGRAQQPKPTKK